MKKIARLMYFAVIAAAVSCNGDALEIDEGETMPDPGPEIVPEATLSLSKTVIEIGGSMFDEGEATIISNQTKFSASADKEWVTAKLEGKILKAIAALPNDTGAERTAVITVIAGKGDNTAAATVSVRQGIRDESSETTILEIANPDAELGAGAGSTAAIAFETNKTEVTATVEESAVSWVKAEISGSSVIITALEDNNTGSIRSAKITVTAGTGSQELSATVKVRQKVFTPEGMVIGALYEGGMIYEITDTYVKIMSLKEATVAWSTVSVVTGTESNPEEGMANTETLKSLSDFDTAYPAAKFCTDLGEGWYMPSRKELNTIYNNTGGSDGPGFDLINIYLEAYGGDPMQSATYYWSSCENNESKAWAVRMSDKQHYQSNKTNERPVRAIKKINL